MLLRIADGFRPHCFYCPSGSGDGVTESLQLSPPKPLSCAYAVNFHKLYVYPLRKCKFFGSVKKTLEKNLQML